MFRNYLTVAIRNLYRHHIYSVTNIFGLAISMTCCILMVRYIQHELSYDRFHRNADHIYRLTGEEKAVTPGPWAPALVDEFPEVRQAVRIKTPASKWYVRIGEHKFWERGFYFADPSFFEVFDFPLILGDPNTVLSAPNTTVITESVARKYFGNEDPIGKSITAENDLHLTVTGVMADMPSNSHFRCEFLTSFVTLELDHRWYQGNIADFNTHGLNPTVYTYLLMQDGYPAAGVLEKLPGFLDKYLGDIQNYNNGYARDQRFGLQSIADIYLHSDLTAEIGIMSDVSYIYILMTLALFIILLACINFMNLATARSMHRAKEVGLRKVVGAFRTQLIFQFMGESFLVAFFALMTALMMIDLSLPFLNELVALNLEMNYTDTGLWLILIGITAVSGALAGIYPALFLSGFQPVTVLKGVLPSGYTKTFLRKGLVVVQFIISTVMIIGTGIALLQLDYLQNKKLGFDKEQVVILGFANMWMSARYPTLKQELLAHPDVAAVTGSSQAPGVPTPWNYNKVRPADGAEEDMRTIKTIWSDYNFIQVMGMELAVGRTFSQDSETDRREAVILNDAAVRSLRLTEPVGDRLHQVYDTDVTPITVIGVVRDFHTQSLHQPIEPTMIRFSNNPASAFVRIRSTDIPQTIEAMQQIWDGIYPDYPFEYSFLDQDLDNLYQAEQRLQRIFGAAAVLSIIIACLGVFGLASFMFEQRTKEIGIRKVIGASRLDILRLLSNEYVLLVGLANLIAWPVAYTVMRQWLSDFAYRIEMGPGVFLAAGIMTLGIVLLTIGYHAHKLASANPLGSLRYE